MMPILCRKLHSVGWAVSHVAISRNDVSFLGSTEFSHISLCSFSLLFLYIRSIIMYIVNKLRMDLVVIIICLDG